MRKLLMLAALLFVATSARSQNPSVIQPNCTFGFSFTAIGRSTTFQNVTPGVSTKTCTSWTMVYSSVGFSTLSIELDEAPDAGATPGVSPGSWAIWPAGQIAAGQTLPATSITNAGVTAFGFFPWISVNLNSVTGTGTITGVVYGWQTQGSQESNTGATQTQGVTAPGVVPTTGNPVQISPNAPTKPWDCALSALVATLTQCQAAPASGRLYITDITVDTTTATAGTYLIEYGTGTNCASGTTKLYPSVNGPAGWTAPVLGAPQKINFQTPLQPAALNAICVIGTATNTINVELEGFIAP